jgi:uncharacterized protein (TIGR02996 family)
MPTEQDLLDAIDANPADDAPRLAHADWLDANGDPERAEFIRLQVKHDGMPFGGAEDQPGFERQHALVAKNERRWLGSRPRTEGLVWNFTRGYPDFAAFTSLDVFDREWPRVFNFPVRWVEFRDVRSLARLAASPGLARVRCLSLRGINERGVLTILRSPHLGMLEGLEVQEGRLTGATLAFLATSPKFARLRELTLVGSRSNAGDFAGFIGSPNLAGLRRLGLLAWGLNAESVRPFWARPWPSLVSLDLTNNPLGPGGLVGLKDGARLASLERLSLSVAALGDEGASALARATRLTGLRWLELHHDGIGEAGTRALADAPHLARLETLWLQGNVIPDGGAEALSRSRHLGRVTSMNLTENLIGDAGMRSLGQAVTLTSLRCLYTRSNPARPELAEQVADRFRYQLPPLPDEQPRPAARIIPPGQAVGDADEDGLVRAILADPWDGLARFAYADWLEENDSPLHAELMRLPPGDGGTRKILDALAGPILGSLPGGDKATLAQEHGLLVVFRMQLRAFLSKRFQQEGPAWLRRHHVARIVLIGATKDWRRVGDAPVMRHLRGLTLHFVRFTEEGAGQLAGSAGLANLASFGLRDLPLTPSEFRALACSPNLARLCHLDLSSVPLRAEWLQALADAAMAPSLRHLAAVVASIDDAGAVVLAQSAGLANLTTLDLTGNRLRAPGVQALACSPHLTRLRNLDLRGNLIGEDGVGALANSPLVGRLRRLRLYKSDGWAEAYKAVEAALAPGAQLIVG